MLYMCSCTCVCVCACICVSVSEHKCVIAEINLKS